MPLYLGKHTPGVCDRCSRKVKHSSLREEYVRGKSVGNLVCTGPSGCWDKDHPQLWVGSIPIADKQSVDSAQPEPQLAAYRSFWGFSPVGAPANEITVSGGSVSVTIG